MWQAWFVMDARRLKFHSHGYGIILIAAVLVNGCFSPQLRPAPSSNESKIQFRLDNIRPDGLRGPPNGLVAVSYEFCVPADDDIYTAVRRIDPSVKIHPRSRGRIGCTDRQALCLGNTHQPNWHGVLNQLAALPYVTKIQESVFE